jgi:2,3-dihydroxybenzoate decarboxylase
MSGKIALEEHFALPETLGEGLPPPIRDGLLDRGDRLVELMDRSGVDVVALSLNAPAVQAVLQPADAVQLARRANDALADIVVRHRGRLVGLAALPMQDADAASREAERSIKELGFKGVLVNSWTASERGPLYYDSADHAGFWQNLEALDLPFYLHPRDPPPQDQGSYLPWLMSAVWAFEAQTSLHALRLIGSGLFDRCPRLQMILGHLGEGLPYSMWRISHRASKMARGVPAQRPLRDYLRTNLHITVSGNFHAPSLQCALTEMGAGRIMFAVDHPYEDLKAGSDWLDSLPLADSERNAIAYENARRLLKLSG